MYTDVKWLSCGKMAERFLKLLPNSQEFFLNHDLKLKFEFLYDKDWTIKLSFLCDITNHLNELNVTLRKKILIYSAISKIYAFTRKLLLFREQIMNNEYTHFPCVSESNCTPEFYFQFFIEILDSLINEFENRYSKADYNAFQLAGMFLNSPQCFSNTDLKVLATTFNCDISNLELQLIDFQSESELTSQSTVTNNLEEKWKMFPNNYDKLKNLAMKILTCFSSTYVCEMTFSSMEFIKMKYYSSLTYESLQSSLICSVTELTPRYTEIVSELECHPSNKFI